MEAISKTKVQRAKEVLREEERRKASEVKATAREKIRALKAKKKLVLKDLSNLNKEQFKEQAELSAKLSKLTQTRMEFEAEEQKLHTQLEKLAERQANSSRKTKLKSRLDALNNQLSELGVATPSSNETTEDKE